MENESSISFGGTIILPLSLRKTTFGEYDGSNIEQWTIIGYGWRQNQPKSQTKDCGRSNIVIQPATIFKNAQACSIDILLMEWMLPF